MVSDEFFLDIVAPDEGGDNNPPILNIETWEEGEVETLEEGEVVNELLDDIFVDPDGDLLTYTVSGLPPGLFHDTATNHISGTLTNADVGTYTVRIAASDGRGGLVSEEFFLNVVAADAVGNEDNTACLLYTSDAADE